MLMTSSMTIFMNSRCETSSLYDSHKICKITYFKVTPFEVPFSTMVLSRFMKENIKHIGIVQIVNQSIDGIEYGKSVSLQSFVFR